jgi:hypothetical protein
MFFGTLKGSAEPDAGALPRPLEDDLAEAVVV